MITIVFFIAAAVFLALAWMLGKHSRISIRDFTPAPATLITRRFREGRLCPIVEFELGDKAVRCSCLPVSAKNFPLREGASLTIYYRQGKMLGMNQLTVAADTSSIQSRRMILRISAIAFGVVSVAMLAIAVIFLF